MNLKDLSSVKLSKLTSEYTDQLKCLECLLVSAPAQAGRDSGAGSPLRVVKAAEIPQTPKSEVWTQQRNRYEAPATASCGHTLCHTCWRGRRTCPLCASTLDRKLLKLNLPLQNLTNHTQTLGEAFEKLFKIQLDEFSLDTPGDLESDKDPVKNVKDWLTSSQNHFSAPIQNSETLSQESQQPHNPLEISASNIIIHTDVKKNVSPPKVTKIVHVPPPQDDWDKIETMPDVEINPKHKENIVGPMDIEPFFVNENEYTTNNPRRSSRKRDLKHDGNQQIHDRGANKHTSMESSSENDKKSQKSKQTWNSVKKMRKEFSKLNKKNRGKLNVSIEMFKKAQNVKPISNTPIIATQQVDAIDENTPDNIDKENDILILNSNNPNHNNQDTNPSKVSNETGNDKLILTQSNSGNNSVSNSKNTQNVNVNDGNCVIRKDMSPKGLDSNIIKNNILKEEVRMPFLKKSALCPKIVEVTHDKEPCTNKPSDICDHETITSSSDDIEISIKIGSTITNIVIKKKNDIQVKINTDREVQTSLGPHDLGNNQVSSKDKKDKSLHNIDINIGDSNNPRDQININRSMKTQEVPKIAKSTSEKKNTASAETATAQFEITESVEKELSNVMEYETAEEQKETSESVNNVSKIQHDAVPQIQENLENFDELNDLDIFSGSVKEANVHILKENAPSEILISTVCSKLKTQKHAEKRNRENTEDETLPKNKKVKVTSQHKVKDKSTLPDSEPINYDAIMGQVFASIDADMEDIRNGQETQNIVIPDETVTNLKNKDLSQAQKTQIIAHCSSQKPKQNVPELNEKNSENIFTTLEKDDHSEGNKNIKIPQQVQELLTPVLCQNIDSSQESLEDSQRKIKSNKKSQEFDDSDRSVVEETPQKDLSFPKAKRTSTSNLSQISLSETRKLPSKVSDQNMKSIIVLTDTVRESSDSNKDISIVEPFGKKQTMETPLTITKFADHIIHKSTPMARKSLNFDNENEDNDPEQTLCPTTDVIAKTTQEKEFMAKAFENTPTTPMARPQMNKIVTKPNKNYCLVASRLTSEEIIKVKLLCAHQKWRYVDSYSKDITHLIVSVDHENKSQRSVKYMCALADSKWIVSFAWIERCLRSKTVADEELFEALDSFGEPGPQRSRIATQKLFQGINFYCMPPFSVLDVVTLKNILTAAGGRVVKEIKEVRVTKDSCQPALLLAEPENTQEDRFIYLAMEHSIVPINFEWVLNCLGSYTLGSIQDLLLCPSALLPEATARWPEVLLAQEFE